MSDTGDRDKALADEVRAAHAEYNAIVESANTNLARIKERIIEANEAATAAGLSMDREHNTFWRETPQNIPRVSGVPVFIQPVPCPRLWREIEA